MPRKTTKKITKKLPAVHEMIDTKTEDLIPMESPKQVRRLPWVRVAVVVVILGLIAFFASNKGLLVAAVVNGRPIFRWQLDSTLISQYGQQTLDSMISQALINEEAAKAGITVSQADIAKKEADLVQSLGGNVSIDDVLQYQGMTRADFDNQLRLQIMVEKLLGKDITISDADITAYIATSGSTLTATTEAGMRDEAKQAIFSQEINDKLQTWFAGIKAKANILRFL